MLSRTIQICDHGAPKAKEKPSHYSNHHRRERRREDHAFVIAIPLRVSGFLNAYEQNLHRKFEQDFDALERELLERALENAWVAVKENSAVADFDSDEELEAALRRELVEIARFNGANDAPDVT